MGSSQYRLTFFFLPNLFVGLAYVVFLKRPVKVRLMAALPSAVFVLVPVLSLGLGMLEIRYEAMAKVVGVVAFLLYLLGLGLVFLNLARTRTWWHLLQVVNVIAGTMLWYFSSLVLNGDLS